MTSPRMERKEIKKALAKASRPKSRKMMKEPMAEPLAKAPFSAPQHRGKSIVEIRDSVPGAFIVDVKSSDGRMVAERVKVKLTKKTRVYDEENDMGVTMWTSYRLAPSLKFLHKVLVAEHDSPYRVKDQEDVKEVVAMLSHEDDEVRLGASTSLYRALVKGLDLRKHVKEIAAAMFDESDIVRISNSHLLFSMACCEVDIREAEDLLRKVMEEEHKLPRYYAALALGKMYWYEGNREGLESIMHELSKNDRKIIMETIDQMPAPANDPYRS